MKDITEEVYDYIQRGYTDEQINTITGQDKYWIATMREKAKENGLVT